MGIRAEFNRSKLPARLKERRALQLMEGGGLEAGGCPEESAVGLSAAAAEQQWPLSVASLGLTQGEEGSPAGGKRRTGSRGERRREPCRASG